MRNNVFFYVLVFLVSVRIIVTVVERPKSDVMPGTSSVVIYDTKNSGVADMVIQADTNAVGVTPKYIRTKPTPEQQKFFLAHQ